MMHSLSERQHGLKLFDDAVAQGARKHKAADVMGCSLRTLQRWRRPDAAQGDRRSQRLWEPGNKLSNEERARVLAVVNSDEFKDKTPHQIVPILAERGEYIASESTLYRILKAERQVTHRHASQAPKTVSKPKALTATAPNQVYSWDITYLATTLKGHFFYLYLFMDLFSRKIVGWQVYEQESSERAADLVQDIYRCENLSPNQVILHSDNGSPMKGATLLATLQKLGIAPSRSRPAVSNDNPYSESLFKTLKYDSRYPTQPFATIAEARAWVESFVCWYNHEHRHSGIQFVTPAQRHNGEDQAILRQRHAVYQAAKAKNPMRWSQQTRNWEWQAEVYLNPDQANEKSSKQAPHTIH